MPHLTTGKVAVIVLLVPSAVFIGWAVRDRPTSSTIADSNSPDRQTGVSSSRPRQVNMQPDILSRNAADANSFVTFPANDFEKEPFAPPTEPGGDPQEEEEDEDAEGGARRRAPALPAFPGYALFQDSSSNSPPEGGQERASSAEQVDLVVKLMQEGKLDPAALLEMAEQHGSLTGLDTQGCASELFKKLDVGGGVRGASNSAIDWIEWAVGFSVMDATLQKDGGISNAEFTTFSGGKCKTGAFKRIDLDGNGNIDVCEWQSQFFGAGGMCDGKITKTELEAWAK